MCVPPHVSLSLVGAYWTNHNGLSYEGDDFTEKASAEDFMNKRAAGDVAFSGILVDAR